jgi:hypothetical protein
MAHAIHEESDRSAAARAASGENAHAAASA